MPWLWALYEHRRPAWSHTRPALSTKHANAHLSTSHFRLQPLLPFRLGILRPSFQVLCHGSHGRFQPPAYRHRIRDKKLNISLKKGAGDALSEKVQNRRYRALLSWSTRMFAYNEILSYISSSDILMAQGIRYNKQACSIAMNNMWNWLYCHSKKFRGLTIEIRMLIILNLPGLNHTWTTSDKFTDCAVLLP